MNNGKICISISAETSAELLKKFERAEATADVVELRFDGMRAAEVRLVFAALKPTKPVLFTYRPRSQGGNAPDAAVDRVGFWMSLFSECEVEKELMWLDNEIDFGTSLKWSGGHTSIRSFHDFSGVPDNLDAIYRDLEQLGNILKIAAAVENATHAIPLWKLLEHADENHDIIPIAMGEAGKWTRALSLAHGAFMTYASLESSSETAPGQISADDLINVFRVKELDRDTEAYGLIAGDTGYSVSPWMHNAAFKEREMNCVFVPFQTNNLDEFMRRMVMPETREVELNLRGFSVTNPHKKEIIRYLDRLDETAKKIGAVNTVKIENGKLLGYNTDAHGFITPLKKVLNTLKGKRVAIAGAGGAARACTYALKQEGADVTIYARKQRNAIAFAEEFDVKYGNATNSFRPGTVDILVNTTPLGTKGENENAAIVSGNQLSGIKLIYDLVYNPLETHLLFEARRAGIQAIGGLEMLVAQGAKQFEIWTGQPAPIQKMAAAVKKKLK